MVEQNEFLDIILTGDKSGLKKPLEGYSQAATLPAIPGYIHYNHLNGRILTSI